MCITITKPANASSALVFSVAVILVYRRRFTRWQRRHWQGMINIETLKINVTCNYPSPITTSTLGAALHFQSYPHVGHNVAPGPLQKRKKSMYSQCFSSTKDVHRLQVHRDMSEMTPARLLLLNSRHTAELRKRVVM